ncbi:hypothetical protein K458DRAFT_317429 [Lentithecium fluviatile CBS 122367]|uniref:DUF3176 domain containing protein n=1 Tax=Lentithecium fluviatile CBS 122367 TaxID=1168545 RepID=A0A6G1IJG1_9PLEO|nr:hypothetical protein K458DRAFT_317429 [Lentithecium fluviatile CBS 122367]
MYTPPLHPSRVLDTNAATIRNPDEAQRAISSPPSFRESRLEKSSLDITQRLERKLAHLSASDNVLKRWMYELISWTISALSMGAIMGILLYLNNHSLTKWPSGLTVIAVLSKLASAALILPVSEALGQLKWIWFNGKKSKEIWDFEIFDKASRGAWGSAMLLFRTRGRSLAALGALLTLLLLATDTFFQQVVNLPERWNLEGSSSIPKVTWYEPEKDGTREFRGDAEMLQKDESLWPKAQKFLYGNGTQPVPFGNGTKPEIPVSCPTSNCTWPSYRTLGVCSQCTDLDVSQFLTFTCLTARADWIANLTGIFAQDAYPNGTMCGYFFNATSDSPVMMSGYSTVDMESTEGKSLVGEALLMRAFPLVSSPKRKLYFGGSINFKHIRNPLANVVIAASASGAPGVYRNETPVTQECVLYWCVKEMQSSYYLATYEEKTTQTFTNTTPGQFPWQIARYESTSLNGTIMTYDENVVIQSESDIYGVSNVTHVQAYSIFEDVFPSFTTTTNISAQPTFRFQAQYKTKPRYKELKFNPWIPPNNVSRHMERLSDALTSALRSSSSNEMVMGSAFSVETYVNIQWEWLIFPFTLLILTLVFLVATMVKTKKGAGEENLGVWKTSAMPTLIYGLPSPMQKQFTSSSTWSSALDKSKNMKIRLHPKSGWRVSGQPCTPDTPVIAMKVNQAPPGWI